MTLSADKSISNPPLEVRRCHSTIIHSGDPHANVFQILPDETPLSATKSTEMRRRSFGVRAGRRISTNGFADRKGE